MSDKIFEEYLRYLCRGIVSTYTKALTVVTIQLLMGDWGYTETEAHTLLEHLKQHGFVTYYKGEYFFTPAFQPYLAKARKECRI